jgi:putative IMPACT (imprinted ancient) family translation regulator
MAVVTTESAAKLTEKRSRFVAVLFPATSDDHVKAVLQRQRRKLKRARHHCWAARWRGADGQLVEQSRDDGEVGKPGLRMLQTLQRNDLEGAMVVSRIFGGVKLGPAGVGRAFREVAGIVAREALE